MMNKTGNKGIKRIYNAIFYSLDGLKSAFKTEEALRLEVFMFIFCAPLSIFVAKTLSELIWLIFSLFLIILMELINSALESVVDLVTQEKHDLAKKAKILVVL